MELKKFFWRCKKGKSETKQDKYKTQNKILDLIPNKSDHT